MIPARNVIHVPCACFSAHDEVLLPIVKVFAQFTLFEMLDGRRLYVVAELSLPPTAV